MIDNPRRRILIALAGGLLFASPAGSQPGMSIAAEPGPSRVGKQPKIGVKCMQPGGSRAMTCGAKFGADIELQATGDLSDAPAVLIIREVGGGGQQARLQPKWFIDHGEAIRARAPAPRQLCPVNAEGQLLQFEIHVASPDQNPARSAPVGSFQMRC